MEETRAMKPSTSVKEKKSVKETNSKLISFLKNNCKNVLAVIVVIVAIMFAIKFCKPYLFNNSQQVKEDNSELRKNYSTVKEAFDHLKNEFPKQTKQLWRVSSAAVRSLLSVDNPKHPAVILLAAPKRSSQSLDCLAQKMSEAVNQLFPDETPVVVFDSQKHIHEAGDVVKSALNTKFSEAFDNGAKVGLVLSVESLPGKSPMIFYRLCDTAEAAFKNVVYILTLNLSEEPDSDEEVHAQKELERLWNPVLDKDQVHPLFSRIANSVAYVREETENKCAD